MTNEVIRLEQLGRGDVALAGGKGANLGELTRIEGVRVPTGFCVSTEAFDRVIGATSIDALIEQPEMPADLVAAIVDELRAFGPQTAWAVRSSATAEDLPTASFAGQHDTYLDVVGETAIFESIRRCWASLFTDRAVAYRQQNGIDHRSVRMAVIVQQMVNAHSSGVMFTADPVTSDRTVVAIEAILGLGEALVSGLVTPDAYTVRGGQIVDRVLATQDAEPVLTDLQVVQLAVLGRRIEEHFGAPQDIEWCVADGDIHVVQSRPITTLFPIPAANDDANHVYVSVGHGQMMTDAMKPLGLSIWQMTTPAPMREAGGRLFVDVTMRLATPASRAELLELFGKSDPLLRDALQTVLDRGDFVPSLPDDAPAVQWRASSVMPLEIDPAIVTALIDDSRASVAACAREIQTTTGPALFDFIVADFQELRRVLFDQQSNRVYMTAMDATWWLNEHMLMWLGEKNVADALTQSVPGNVTSEMGLALLDVADVIRSHPAVVAFLQGVGDDGFLDALDAVDGGRESRTAIQAFLDQYGMRCVGEIDITRPRWSERPTALLPVLLGHVENMEPGEAARRFQRGLDEAAEKEADVLERLAGLPDGDQKVAETKLNIDRVRTFMGYREYPKYGMVSRYFIYKQALLREADRLVQSGLLRDREDIFFLRFHELDAVVRTDTVDQNLIEQRKEVFRSDEALKPPRVITSDGEALSGAYHRDDLPNGALVGLGVSSGTVEGRARVVRNIADAALEPGDILVTAFTDPSWTPMFVTIAGLVTEVGGMMTHGAVIAREYGLPAVVAVERATQLIRDGQRIRIDGTDGWVIVLSPDAVDATEPVA